MEERVPSGYGRTISNKLRMGRRRQRKHGAIGEPTVAEIFSKIRSYHNRCYYCYGRITRKKYSRFTLDHFIPLSRGGTNSIENIVPCCHSCNQLKKDLWPWEFKKGETETPREPRDWVLQEDYGDRLPLDAKGRIAKY